MLTGLLTGWVAPAAAKAIRIIALGDSLTAGYGLPEDAAFPAVLQKALRQKGYGCGPRQRRGLRRHVGGPAGPARLDAGRRADAAIVEIGANDMLRGFEPAGTKKNIDAISPACASGKFRS